MGQDILDRLEARVSELTRAPNRPDGLLLELTQAITEIRRLRSLAGAATKPVCRGPSQDRSGLRGPPGRLRAACN
jgi:hypothetical protein